MMEIGGQSCPLLVMGSNGQQYEVTLPAGYILDLVHAGDAPRSGLIGPDDTVITALGGTVRITLTGRTPPQSTCRWGVPVEAREITSAP